MLSLVGNVRWGVAGPGGIAERFANALASADGGELVSVGSRDLDRARAFADRYGAPRAWGAYADLLIDDEVDAIYVATPHPMHHQLTVDALAAGKHVLCEKPLALHAGQARAMAEAARQADRFLMEAIWSRFLPAYRTVRELLDDGDLGAPVLVEADFGFPMPVSADHRLFARELGGGAGLDLGIYPLQLCSWILGPPSTVQATGRVGVTGVDEVLVVLLGHDAGSVGIAKAALTAELPCRARITCERGWIELPPFMHDARQVRVGGAAGRRTIECDYEGDGLRFEIEEVHRCLAAGLRESPTMPIAESVRLAETLDAALAQVGAGYADSSS